MRSPEAEPEEHLYIHDGLQMVMKRLGPQDGPKWLILWWLREGPLECEWSEIARSLADASDEIAPLWERVCTPFSSDIPRQWAEVCRYFHTPPPEPTTVALRQWYSRLRRHLLSYPRWL
jgi:hypothetical protein